MPEITQHQMTLKFILQFLKNYRVSDLLEILASPDVNTFCTVAQSSVTAAS
jgi:hypothetical protein